MKKIVVDAVIIKYKVVSETTAADKFIQVVLNPAQIDPFIYDYLIKNLKYEH